MKAITTSNNSSRIISVIAAIVMVAAMRVWAANPLPTQTYFVPMDESNVYAAMVALGAPAASADTVHNIISLVANSSNTYIYYDQWEDGYEPNISAPVQSTTRVWGDGNVSNGIPPGFAVDRIKAGDVIALSSDVVVPYNDLSLLYYDGRDKIGASKPIALAYSCWPTDIGPVLADGTEVYDTTVFGTNFFAPIGTNTGIGNMFNYSSLLIMPAQDNTLVEVDADANGTFEISTTLAAGVSFHVNGGVCVGARVRASAPVQVDMVTGRINAGYEMRWYTLYPRESWGNRYYMPVGTTDVNAPAAAFVFNPHASTLVVRYDTTVGTSYLDVAPQATVSVQMPSNSGGDFRSTNGLPFNAVMAMDADAGGRDYDWGASLIPDTLLTPEALVGWGPGSSDLTRNGSPVWVTAVTNARLFVDFDGDPTTGPYVDGNGRHYNTNFVVNALASRRIFNTTGSNDQTKMRVYTTNQVNIAVVWGEDP
ncbi:MAG: hypothetical protein NTV22_09055, partial [bacterium]|nr:hypothetical protein [bacterium]